MSLQPAKCPNCGAILKIDTNKDAGICEYCGTPFITEKAINNYITNIKNEFNIENANISVTGKSYRAVRLYSVEDIYCIYLDDKLFLNIDNLDEDGSITFEMDTERHLISFNINGRELKHFVIERGNNNLYAVVKNPYHFELCDDNNDAKAKYDIYLAERQNAEKRKQYDQLLTKYHTEYDKLLADKSDLKFSINSQIFLLIVYPILMIIFIVFACKDSELSILGICFSVFVAILFVVALIMKSNKTKQMLDLDAKLTKLKKDIDDCEQKLKT